MLKSYQYSVLAIQQMNSQAQQIELPAHLSSNVPLV